ncbi:hypothetical protein [Leuconostoc gasicomitatum]|uniref:hypothetical protein n=1 Tax=Leuconostoc gasicomitatum TaxID=115778 RepID=UPI001CC73486|nr:hypothetical protein [Leuconostoc gasicomitatum]MBZ5997283.1 hypothetical protein [Leuconostoc gasicomitatum]
MLEKLDELLKSPSITPRIKTLISTLTEEGKLALNDFYDEKSDFYQHAEPMLIANKFNCDPNIFPNLYHYTSIDVLKNIISKKKIYLGSIHSMNDQKDGLYAFELGAIELESLGASKEEIQDFNLFNKNIPRNNYIWSFSANDHSQSLQHYGEIALSFNNQDIQYSLSKHFSKGANDFSEFSRGNGFSFPLKVEYDIKTQLEYIKPVVKEWLYAYRNINVDSSDMLEIMQCSAQAMFLFSLCFKNPDLYQEEEIRFVVVKINGKENDIEPEIIFNGKPVVSLEITPSLIKSVILSHEVFEQETNIRNILNQSNFTNTTIEKTRLPY